MSAYVEQHRDRFGVEPICRVLEVSASAYYARRKGRALRSPDRRRAPARRDRGHPCPQLLRLRLQTHDLRHSLVSLLIHEGQSILEVARQAGHSPQTCLRDYGHLFDEFDPAVREPAEAMIRAARDELVPLSYLSTGAD